MRARTHALVRQQHEGTCGGVLPVSSRAMGKHVPHDAYAHQTLFAWMLYAVTPC